MHHWVCRSAGWKNVVEREVVPWAMKEVAPDSNVLEIGPGFGVTTEVIRRSVERLTCVEIDARLAEALRRKTSGHNVTVVCEDATAMSAKDSSFDAVVCFTMLHHVPSVPLQDRLLAEVSRVLRPGGVFVGTDSLYSWRFRLLHVFDTMVIVSPQTFAERLRAAGLADIWIDATTSASRFRFRARKPVAERPLDEQPSDVARLQSA